MEQGRSTSLRLSRQKLIPRDISESMGKVPPSATDLEESVLGVILQNNGITQVPYLKPEHFYLEPHRIIFHAALTLHQQNKPVDYRTVVHELRQTGKLELLGDSGPAFLVELTSNIVSGANIDYHARVIVEMAMKRMLIQQASQIHQDAYKDTTDVFELLRKTQEDLKFLEERETASSGPERIKLLWDQTLITSKPEEQPPLIYLDQTPVCTPGNHTLLIGKKKSRKSLLVTHLLHLFLKARQHVAEHIAVFDTEQGKLHVWKARDRIYRMTNQNVPFFWLRGKSPVERREFIAQTIEYWIQRSTVFLKIVVIDGIRDLMSNINDPDETTEVLVWLEKLTIQYNLSIINILHINKTDNNARGHIGSELLNKAECTIEVEYDEKTHNSIVKCESSREKPFEPFAFTHGPTGLPELLGAPAGQSQDNRDQMERLQQVFEGQVLRYKELVEQIGIHFQVGEKKSKSMVPMFVKRGWIAKSGAEKSSDSRYKLMVQVNGDSPVHFADTPMPLQTEMFESAPMPTEEPPDLPEELTFDP